MPREAKKKTIDGVEFSCIPLGFARGRAVFVRLVKTIGPALVEAAKAAPDIASLKSMLGAAFSDTETLGAVATQILESVDDDALEWFANELGGEFSRYTTDGGAHWVKLDREGRERCFDGRMFLFFKWLGFALEANFGEYFRASSAPAKEAPPAEVRASS